MPCFSNSIKLLRRTEETTVILVNDLQTLLGTVKITLNLFLTPRERIDPSEPLNQLVAIFWTKIGVTELLKLTLNFYQRSRNFRNNFQPK